MPKVFKFSVADFIHLYQICCEKYSALVLEIEVFTGFYLKKNYLQLLQLGIFRERDDPYMNEMVDWWLIEGDLREKFFDVLVPRFAHDPGIFMLP